MAKYAQVKGWRIEKLTDVIRVLNPKEHFITVDAAVGRFRVDSRAIEPGDIFLAVKGARSDGHQYVDQVLKAGAGAALVSSLELVSDRSRCILVEDTLEALRLLAASHRRSLDTKIIGLTGSVGKTTTKEILAALLSAFMPTCKSEGNYNNTIGLPMEILRLTPKHQWMVAEMGMSTPGELRLLADLVDPEIVMFMAVRAVHLANFANLEGIAAAKAELVEGMRPEATLIYNADDPLVVRHCLRHPGPKIAYGVLSPKAQVRARIEPFPDWEGTRFTLNEEGGRGHEMNLPLVGKYNVFNALAACAAALAVGIPAHELRHAMHGVTGAKGRSCLHSLEATRLVDDTYNANPDAVYQVIRSFAPLASGHYRWILLGDMLELGPEEAQIHAELGRDLATSGFDRITLVGPLSANGYAELERARPEGVQFEHFFTTAEAIEKIAVNIPADARIWLKASRGIGLEHLAQHLLQCLSHKG